MDDPRIETVTFESMTRILRGQPKTGLIGMNGRVGVRSFMVFFEHRYFPPGTSWNSDFEYFLVKWEMFLWEICIFPNGRLAKADALLAKLGLHRSDGVPMILDSEGKHSFPIQLPNIYTLENVRGHFIYENNATGKTALELEAEAVEREIQSFIELRKQKEQKERETSPSSNQSRI
jgi:hypothetical protein